MSKMGKNVLKLPGAVTADLDDEEMEQEGLETSEMREVILHDVILRYLRSNHIPTVSDELLITALL